MLITVLAFATLSLPPPDQFIDATWGLLTRAPHLHGRWSVTLASGRELAGDWVVLADAEESSDPRFGYRHWIRLVSSTTDDRCSVATDEPDRLWCEASAAAAGEPTTEGISLATPFVRDPDAIAITGRLTVDVRAVTPSLDQERRVFAAIHAGTLTDVLAARGYEIVEAKTTRTATSLRVRYATTSAIAGRDRITDDGMRWFELDVIRSEATIRIGRDRRAGAMKARELERFVEACSAIASYNGCCQPPPPQCERVIASEPAP